MSPRRADPFDRVPIHNHSNPRQGGVIRAGAVGAGSGSSSGTTPGLDSGTWISEDLGFGDGATTTYRTSNPFVPGSILAFAGATMQLVTTLDNTVGTFAFSFPPTGLDLITVFYQRIIATPPTAPPDTPPAGGGGGTGTGSLGALYGAAVNLDTKANIRIGDTDHQRCSHRFVASTSSTADSVRFAQRGGSGYSLGTGGVILITVQGDTGGDPDGTPIASQSFTPGNPAGAWSTYVDVTFSSPASLVSGTTYHIVFENTDADQDNNWISVNEVFVYGSVLSPRQPVFADADYGVLTDNGGGWGIEGRYTADMDITYGDGSHDGMAYIQNMIALYGDISGTTNMVREAIACTSNQTATAVYVRVRRTSGSDPLIVSLLNGSGALMDSISIPSASVPITAPGGDDGGSVWVGDTFSGSQSLVSGQSYSLVLSCAGTSEYSAACIRQGTTEGFLSFAFRDGRGQYTTNGTTWSDLYAFDDVDIQFYFVV